MRTQHSTKYLPFKSLYLTTSHVWQSMSNFVCVVYLFRQTHPFAPQRASLLHIRKIFSTLRWQIKQGLQLYSQKADKKADRKGQKEDGKWLFYQHTISIIHHLTCTCWLFYQHSLNHPPSDMHLLVILPTQSQSSTI